MDNEDVNDPWIPRNNVPPFLNNNNIRLPSSDRGFLPEAVISIKPGLTTEGNCQDGRCYKGIDPQLYNQLSMCESCHISSAAEINSSIKDAITLTEDAGVRTRTQSICYSSSKQPIKNVPKHARQFYKEQNRLIETFEEIYSSMEDDGSANDRTEQRTLRLASIMSMITFTCNLTLLFAKCVAAILSGSLVIISSLLDSAMDLVSGLLMWWSNRAIKNTNYNLYPKGRRKLEPVAIVVLAVIMSFVSVQLIQESIQKMIQYATQNYDIALQTINIWTSHLNGTEMGNYATETELNSSDWSILVNNVLQLKYLLQDCASGHAAPVFETPTIVICVATIVTKLCLYLVCRRIDNPSVQALAKDHFNDVISNTGAIACGLIGYKLWKYADPIGAILISLSIIINWSITAHDQIRMLTGYTARPTFIKKITWLALNHDPRIQFIDSVIAFHFGSRFLVELDIVLPGEMSMRESHDLSEALQRKIERLPEVERAFIHIDYECGYYVKNNNLFTPEELPRTSEVFTNPLPYDNRTSIAPDATSSALMSE